MAKQKKAKVDNSQYSSYWFDEDDYTTTGYFGSTSTDADDADDEARMKKQERMVELLKLGAFMRSCGNFVRILTGKDIPVKYKEGDDSYTDGKVVTLSSKVENNFDSTVGLALHEASHICLTDFEFLKKLIVDSKFRREFISEKSIAKVIAINPKIEKWNWSPMFDGAEFFPDFEAGTSDAHRCADLFLVMQFKDILNWIEDRRIDNWVYTTASGYRGYYDALYNRYFLSEEVTKDLKKGGTHNTETLDSYMYRIINLMNDANDISVLKGMPSIKKDIDYTNIARLGYDLSGTTEVAKVSKRVIDTIIENITELDYATQQVKKFGVGDGGEDGMTVDLDSLTDEQIKEMFGMSRKQLEKLLDKMNEQRKFVRGQTDKKKLSKTDAKQMDNLQVGGVTMELAGGEEFGGQTVRVLVIEKITDALVEAGEFSDALASFQYPMRSNENAISKGFILGKMLGHKLQVRNEEKTLKHTRLDSGKLDKRLVASLGYDVSNVFSKIETNKFSKAHLHISIDASGSMNGGKIDNAIKTAVALAVACRMTNNLECVITFRTTHQDLPLVFVAYDSRKNGLGHIRKYFPLIYTNGTTPESLCYEAMMRKVFPKTSVGENFYFVNLSDGEPMYSARGVGNSFSYHGDSAYRHCKRMVDMMVREYGATIVSYFISGWSGDTVSEGFKRMYGASNAFSINTDRVDQIAKTMNKKFLEGGNKTQTENIV